ncbi:ankyrin-like protein [Plasmopara halstedii]|uniref:Ankyrin-like protein n=1 Tax=Plasmopara halstedii TaxID=4781 RepID=A0A0P1AES4_PLAHL|nr:ankyrin-like protein [Plasmopara halstedii]CEG38890.1 ankyrin-like protein [Plasmopara halstedii]|eukprot:XP_024575259.1 ankyrin-like protein [Plasmopara halstedii]
MTETVDYHALSEQNTILGHRAQRPSGSTDEAMMDLLDLEDDSVISLPRGTPKPLPTAFLGSGYGRNSYFTWRLRMSTLLVATLGTAGIVTFWTSNDIGHGGVFVRDVGYALAFHRTKTTACIAGTDYCGACDTIVVYAMLVYHVAPLLVIIGLPASGLRIFEPFQRRRDLDGGGRQKIQRSVFFQGCELLSVVVLVFSLLVILYYVYALFQGNNFYCKQVRAILYVTFAVGTFFANFVVLTYFARFREHLSMQLGAFKETDQTGGIRSRLQRRHKYKSERARVINDLRKHLYKETSLGNLHKIETLLQYAKERLGTEFAHEMYNDAKLVCKLFGRSKKNPLHVAAYLGNTQALQLFVEAGFRIDSYDKVSRVRFTTGDLFWTFAQIFVSKPYTIEDEMAASIFRTTLVTPLHCAVSTGQIQAVQWLIEHKANVNLKSRASYWSDRLPPLFVADNPDIVTLLLEAGANHLEVPDPGHMNTLTVLQMAYMRGNFPVAHELEQWGADVALTPLHEAAAKDNTTLIKKLLKTGADPNCVGEYGYTGMHRRTPLHWAAITGATNAVSMLLEAGADPDFQDIFGRSPLHWAARVNKPKVVELLLSKGADVKLRDYRAHTPLLCAASCKNVTAGLFDCLVEHGADIDDRLPNGDTALHIAMKCEQKGTALALLDSGADVMETNRDGYRPVDCTTSTQLQFEIKQAAGDRDVMISYTHSHSMFALKIRDHLERANITSWLDLMDPTGIGGGSVWREEIARGIKNAEVVVCLYTEDYPVSEWCLKELALAKQLGKPIIAVSTENAKVTDEMQVYIYTRQIIPFESAITKIDNSNKRKIVYDYDETLFAGQFRLLLDGVRDEIEKQREAKFHGENRRHLANGTSVTGFADNISDWNAATLDNIQFAFVSHGDHHHSFVKRLHDRLNDNQVRCLLDGTQTYADMTERIHAAKEAILKCDVFIVILSRKTVNSELVKDQLAFAEDKGKPILPVMLNDMEIPLDKHYTLSRLELLHFTPELGFNSSFMQLFNRVRDSMTPSNASFIKPRTSARTNFRAVARMTAMGHGRQNTNLAVTNAARAFLGRPRLSEASVTLV